MRCFPFAILHLLLLLNVSPARSEVIVEPIAPETPGTPGVIVARSDEGLWGGETTGMTHQSSPNYMARKRLDLSKVPADLFDQAKQVRLSIWFYVQDYGNDGLNEQFEIVINDVAHVYPTNHGFIQTRDMNNIGSAWTDFVIPIDDLVRGPNEIIVRKIASPNPNDYIYVGIDNTVNYGDSAVTYDGGKTWRQDELTQGHGAGEYMVRVVFITDSLDGKAVYRHGEGVVDDPRGLLPYVTTDGDVLGMELDDLQFARESDITIDVAYRGDAPPTVAWFDTQRKAITDSDRLDIENANGQVRSTLRPAPSQPQRAGFGFRIEGIAANDVQTVTVRGELRYIEPTRQPNQAPHIAAPAGKPRDVETQCVIDDGGVTLTGPALTCRFDTRDGLRMTSLHNAWIDREMIRDSRDCRIMLIDVDGERFGGEAFRCESVTPLADRDGASIALRGPHDLAAAFECWIDERSQVRLVLDVHNAGTEPIDFKVAFPSLAGLTLSDKPRDDYYLFPRGGGIIADTPAHLRRGYGDNEAMWQMIDLFSPRRGGGLSIRIDDPDGWHKLIELRKVVPGMSEYAGLSPQIHTAAEYNWRRTSLEATPGIGVSFAYLRRTRGPGESFAPEPAVIAAHAGGWKTAMQGYADWAHAVWDWRPFPSQLGDAVNTYAFGWASNVLWRDGKYRDDFITPVRDCVELMSWWEWSPLGPWRTPWDELEERIGSEMYKRYSPYFIKDEATGKTMYSITRGDYDGYNQRWGGLPTFREAVRMYKDRGLLVTLYTVPVLACDNSKLGQTHGKDWGVIDHTGEYIDNYEAWNMCLDNPDYRKFLADQMARVMTDTGADGIRLDVYGFRGWSCFSDKHEHSYQEPGVTQWQKATAESTRLVRQAMDRVAPGSILTTEHPGYDYLLPHIEGTITYELFKHKSWLRPVPCDLGRFYFPECVMMELDHFKLEPNRHTIFWNGKNCFGANYEYLEPMYSFLKHNRDVFMSREAQMEPLVPTLQPHVYANRFAANGKTVTTLFYAGRHPADGELIRIAASPDDHFVDPIAGRALSPQRRGGDAVFSGRMMPEDLITIAQFPSLIGVEVVDDTAHITLPADLPAGARLQITDAKAQPLAEPATQSGDVTMPADAVWIKLLDGERLMDMVCLR
jgi:hypothetical protein